MNSSVNEMSSDEVLKKRDAENRVKALDLSLSFIVQAPAGAGKTELLTQRYLGLLTTVDAPEKIIAITFTRKAAAEMRNRILDRLKKASQPEPELEHERQTWRLASAAMAADHQHQWGILKNPDRLRITTIDSLCASLVRQMPYMSRFGGTPAVAERPAIHYEEAARQTVEAVEDIGAVAKALAYLDNDAGKLQKLLVAMLAFRDQWLIHVGDLRTKDSAALRAQLREELTASLRRLIERDLSLAAQLLSGIQSPDLMAAARYVADFAPAGAKASSAPILHLQDWNVPLTKRAEDLGRWQALAKLLLTAKGAGTPVVNFGVNNGLPKEKEAPDVKVFKAHKAALKATCDFLRDNDQATSALRAVSACPAPAYAESDLEAIETFVEVLLVAYGFLRVVFQDAGETDFVEVAARALVALGDADEPSELALKLDYEIRHLLVDEFQDTNDHQTSLLEKLTAGWTPQDGRTLFVVGDPMQSIYRFRKADVGLFLRAWNRGIGAINLTPLTLYRNNRSVPNVIDWINTSFQDIFPEEADPERGMVQYSPAIFTKPDPQGFASGTFVHPIIVGVTKAESDEETGDETDPGEGDESELVAGSNIPEDGDELEAKAILDIINAEWQVDNTRNIAVLIRSRRHLAPLVTEIRRNRPTLRYEAVEIESLSERQPIQDLMALTRAICHRGDRVNWLAILRAPWCGLTLADLFLLAKPEVTDASGTPHRSILPTLWSLMWDDSRIGALSDDGKIRLHHTRDALQDVMEYPGRQSLRRQVEGVWLRLGGNICIGSPADVEDVNAFFRLLDKLDATGRFDLDRLESEIEDLFAAPSTDKSAGKLKFMTVHKSKGLEFDTVILPGLHRKVGRNEQKLLTWEATHDDDNNKHLVVAPYKRPDEEEANLDGESEESNSGNSKAIRAYINALEKIRVDQENRRVLYVATTRAIRSLHLLGIAKAKLSKKTGQFEVTEKSSTKNGTPLRVLWPVVSANFDAALKTKVEQLEQETAESASQPVLTDLSTFVPQLQRLRLEHLPQPVTAEKETIAALAIEAAEPIYLSNSSLAPNVGTLVHRYLELMTLHGLDAWTEDRIKGLRPNFKKWLRQQGHDNEESALGAVRVELALINAITDEKGRWILKHRGDHEASELALTHLEDGVMRNSIVDRTFVEDGVRWIIDYKTAAHEGSDLDAFIATKCQEYSDQLARYESLFTAEGLPIKKALYFVDLNRFAIV